MDLIKTLRVNADKLRDARSRIDSELAEIEMALAVIDRYGVEASSAPLGAVERAVAPQRKAPAPTKSGDVMSAVMEVLGVGLPVPTADLLKAVVAKGINVGGNDPEQYLSSILSRNKEQYGIQADRRHGWSLKTKKGEGLGVDSTEAFNLQPAS